MNPIQELQLKQALDLVDNKRFDASPVTYVDFRYGDKSFTFSRDDWKYYYIQTGGTMYNWSKDSVTVELFAESEKENSYVVASVFLWSDQVRGREYWKNNFTRESIIKNFLEIPPYIKGIGSGCSTKSCKKLTSFDDN